MDVGINLHDLRGSGRLGALARALGVNELEALGTATVVWAETQHRELTLVTADSFSEAVALHFDDPPKVLTAMVRARLVSPVETEDAGLGPTKTWLIHGNDRHVAKLQAYRANASAAGKASATARKRFGHQAVSKPLTTRQRLGSKTVDGLASKPSTARVQNADQAPTLVTGMLDAGIDHDLGTSDPDLTAPQIITSDPRSAGTPKSGVTAQSPGSRIRAAYLDGYERKFGKSFGGWGARANGQASQLIRDWPADRVVELLGLFFDWNNPRAIAAGYPFGFFVSAIHELDADTHSPERKRIARTLDAAERQVGNRDAEQLTLDAELAQIRARRAEESRKALGAPSPTGVALP